MRGNPSFYVVFFLLLVFGVTFAGCSDESSSAETTTPTPAHPGAKYQDGDIIATPSSAGTSSLYVILKYDAATDQYTRAVIEKNPDGSWGHRSSDWTEKSPREALEKTYTVKAGHVAISILPVITPVILPETTQNPSGNAPSLSKISPTSAAKDTVVSVTITGSNFQNGATVKLFKAASTPITGTVTSVTAFDLSCLFNLNGKSDGRYNLIVTNPDGQSDSLQGVFTIGEVAPVIAGMYPVTGALNDKIPLTISGQNFRNEVKVSFLKNSTEMVCDNPLSMESSKISCTLDLSKNRGASLGEWNVTVINIRDGQRGTWLKKFVVTNATPEDD
ncbi:MAG: hypothetical protein EHM53_01050 [Methanoregulaceae archaeon]|nr:MAG: hypothetical protein EHM53_01050 [Methanoregulaceae archaeon]